MKLLILFLVIFFASYQVEATTIDFIGNVLYINKDGHIIKVVIDQKDIDAGKIDDIVRKAIRETKNNVQK